MLNINPINHNTNINFKSQRDFSQIYKEMEKITLTHEEKIKPKKSFKLIKEKFFKRTKAAPKRQTPEEIRKKRDRIFFTCFFGYIIVVVAVLGAVINYYYKSKKDNIEPECTSMPQGLDINTNDIQNLETDAFYKADSLENLYKKGSISFADYKHGMQKVIDTYDANAHKELLAQDGIIILPEDAKDINKTKQQYFHDENGNLVAKIKWPGEYNITTDVHCSDVDYNIENLQDRIKQIESDEILRKQTTMKNDSIANQEIKSKADSLINLYKNNTISLNEFQKGIEELNKEQ